MNKIPLLIHYCWFGNGEMPENIKLCMSTWNEKMPEFTLVKWNEDKFDIQSSIPYVKEAYSVGKFAFVSDYVRLCALYEYGGVYLDTDIEVLKSPEPLLQGASLVTGFETIDKLITAFIACDKHNQIIGDFIKEYQNIHFILEDGSYDMTPINDRFTEFMCRYGLKTDNSRQSLSGSVEIYPYTVFCGYDIENSHPKIDETTYTVHHFECSWKKLSFKNKIKFKVIVPILQKILGYDRYDKLKLKLKI